MPVPFLIAILLLLGAVLLRSRASSSRSVTGILKVAIPIAGLLWLGMEIGRGVSTGSETLWRNDGITRTALVLAGLVPLILGLLESSSGLLSALFWSCGLLGLSAVSALPAVQWVSLILSVAPILFYGRTESGPREGILSRHPTLIFGSGLFSIGFFVFMAVHPEHPAATIALVLVLCGMGGMLGWFPFPRTVPYPGTPASFTLIFAHRILPCLIAGVLLFRLVERQLLTDYQSLLLLLAGMFSLAISSARLLKEERFSRRLVLCGCSTLSFLVLTVHFRHWEITHSSQIWSVTSNLPSASSLFASILACETMALLAITCGFRLLQRELTEECFVQPLSGIAVRCPGMALPAVCGLYSMAGLPPFPGFWWRFGLFSICLMPHRQSNVTHVMELDRTFALITICLTFVFLVNMLAHVQMIQRMFLDDPFRVREGRPSRMVQLAAAASLLLLLLLSWIPLSVGPVLEHTRPVVVDESPVESF